MTHTEGFSVIRNGVSGLLVVGVLLGALTACTSLSGAGGVGHVRQISEGFGNLDTDLTEADLAKLGIVVGSAFTVTHKGTTVTARMGTDPRTSVVDKWGATHDVQNLFIIDGSLFVTSGAVNPTSTIQALALRTADYLKSEGRYLVTGNKA